MTGKMGVSVVHEDTQKMTRKTIRKALDIALEQSAQLDAHLEKLDIKQTQWLRDAVREKYERETGKKFADDPKPGAPKRRKRVL